MIFDIQRFSTHDGPGIRTVVFFKGCPLACRWCENPESQSFNPEFLYTRNHCLSCWTCIDAEAKDGEGLARLSEQSQQDHQSLERRVPRPQRAIPILRKDPNGGIIIDRTRPAPLSLSKVCPALALQVAGREASVEEIMAEVRKDKQFYDQSGGGLTLSGGEPLAQIGMALGLAQASLGEGVDIAIETSLAVPQGVLERASKLPFHWLTDLKHVDADTLRTWTGADFSIVAGNLEYLAAHGADLTIRVPVVPGFNDDEASMHRILDFAAALSRLQGAEQDCRTSGDGTTEKDATGEGVVRRAKHSKPLHVDLLPYHDLGASKYARLGREYPFPLGLRVDALNLQHYADYGQSLGLAITIGG